MGVAAIDLVQAEAERLLARVPDRPAMLGLCGAQGSGKSTLARAVADRIGDTVILSIDDLYLTLAERTTLGETIHPLLRTRGVPGTHDVSLGLAVLDMLAHGWPLALPTFDKATDDRVPADEWPRATTPARLIILEGWCVGARPQPVSDLDRPINPLERFEDLDGTWRRYVNAQLAGPYQTLFSRLDGLVFLAAPSFASVLNWRIEQENDLRTRVGNSGAGLMNDIEVARFIAHYERLTRSILAEMPSRADLTIHLDDRRQVVATRTPTNPR